MKKETVADQRVLTPSEIDELLNWYELLEQKEEAAKEEMAVVKARIGAALRAQYGELHPGEYALNGHTYALDVEVGQVWSWDSEKLMRLAEVLPTPHLKISAKIDKERFQALPDELQLKYHDALTVKTGRLKLTLRGGE